VALTPIRAQALRETSSWRNVSHNAEFPHTVNSGTLFRLIQPGERAAFADMLDREMRGADAGQTAKAGPDPDVSSGGRLAFSLRRKSPAKDAIQRARIIVPVTRALIEAGSCARALWTRPKPTTSVTQANVSITTLS
jgi:hypothetical protein